MLSLFFFFNFLIISSLIPMFNLSVEGIEDAMDYLRKGGKNTYTTVHQLKGFAY